MTKFGELTFGDLTFGEMTTVGEMTFGDLTFGEPTGHPTKYRPISNLNPQDIGWLVQARIVPHVSTSPNFVVFQSAYKRHHSTETALLKITDYIVKKLFD